MPLPLINGEGVVVGMGYQRNDSRLFIADEALGPGDRLTLVSVEASNEEGLKYRVCRARGSEPVIGYASSYVFTGQAFEVTIIAANDRAPSAGTITTEDQALLDDIAARVEALDALIADAEWTQVPVITTDNTGPALWPDEPYPIPGGDMTMVNLPWSWGETPKPKRRRKRKPRAKKVAPVPYEFAPPPGSRRFA